MTAEGIQRTGTAGATCDEVAGAIDACVPAAGFEVLSLVPPAMRAFDEPHLRGQD